MSVVNQGLVILFLSLLVTGCSRPGNTEVDIEPDPFHYKLTAEDALLVGLKVIDASGLEAEEVEPGVYQFGEDVEPQTPIRFLSQNHEAVNSSFQDIDQDGVLSGADVAYQVGFELHYIGNFTASGERAVFANPLTALIPATGIPANGIAGLPESVFETAIASGIAGAPTTLVQVAEEVELPMNTLIKRSAALLTAMQEGVQILVGGADGQTAAISFMTELNNLAPSSGLASPGSFLEAVQSALELTLSAEKLEAASQIATQLGTILVEAEAEADDITFFEALILSVQQNVMSNSTAANIVANLTTAKYRANNNRLKLAVKLSNQIAASGGLTAFLNSLMLVPIDIGDNGQSLVDAAVSDFNLEFVATSGKVKFNAQNAFFDQAELDYYFEDDLYGVKVDDMHAVLMTLNANETNLLGAASASVNSARLLALCWHDTEQSQTEPEAVCGADNTNLEFYGLATNGEICTANFDQALVAQINSLNRLQISCN